MAQAIRRNVRFLSVLYAISHTRILAVLPSRRALYQMPQQSPINFDEITAWSTTFETGGKSRMKPNLIYVAPFSLLSRVSLQTALHS